MITQVAETRPTQNKGVTTEQSPFVCSSLEKFFTLTLDMFFIVGLDGYFKQLNPTCEKILGFTTKELLSQPWMELIHPEDRQAMPDLVQQLTTKTGPLQFENRYLCKDGSYKWLLWNAMLSPEEQLIYAIACDDSDRIQAQEAQKESEEHFRLLVEGVNDYAIMMLDPEGRVISWNTGAEHIKYYQASEILGQHVSCFYSKEDIQNGKPEQGLKIAALQGRFEDEGLRIRKDGSKFWANVVTTALRTEDGKLRGFARVTRDITELKLAQEALQKAHDELERRVEERTAELTATNQLLKQEIAEHQRTEIALRQSKGRLKKQAKQLEEEKQHATSLLQELQQTQAQLIQTEKMSSLGQLVAGVAHEINNPISFIYGNIDYANCYIKDLMHLVKLYATHYPDPVGKIQTQMDAIDFDFLMTDLPKLLTSMKVGATRIRQIVSSLQNFLRSEQTEMKEADIHEGIESTLLILQNRLKPTPEHPEIIVHKDYGTLPPVECFAGQLNQVFMNLLTNAIDVLEVSAIAQDIPRCITISTGVREIRSDYTRGSMIEETPHAVIRITDNGPGMSEEVCRRLFDPFFTTKPVGRGTGLGLAISYQIVVEKHGGQLICISELGKGSEFCITIPMRQSKSSSLLSQCA
jgi:PAS domain S-box-containing protein